MAIGGLVKTDYHLSMRHINVIITKKLLSPLKSIIYKYLLLGQRTVAFVYLFCVVTEIAE